MCWRVPVEQRIVEVGRFIFVHIEITADYDRNTIGKGDGKHGTNIFRK